MIKRRPKKHRVTNPLKASTRSAVKKGPARDSEHLSYVRRNSCMVCSGAKPMPKQGWVLGFPAVSEAHHVRCIAPRSMGRRVSDYLTVPLCKFHHTAIHEGNEGAIWKYIGYDPAKWIAQFSPEGAAEIARITNGVTVGSPKDREL